VLGLLGFIWTDYEREAAPALAALVRGDVGGFLSLSPAYGGSLIIRAPFALAASCLGSLVYLAWSLPLVAGLAWRLYAPSVPVLGRATEAVSAGGRTSVWSTTQ
jgi:hypothetical protein